MDLQQIKNAIDFSNTLESRIRDDFRGMLKFLEAFVHIYFEQTTKLPYHINLIDELQADENSHSRIFAKLVSYRENYQYPFLEKFLKQVCNFDLCIETPEVKKVDSCGRIDIPIFDKNYVVVIENKVTDKALDQNNSSGGQLARYIETIKSRYSKKSEEIYVVYTPKYTREPSEESWINKDNFSYKSLFKLRFRSLSYRDVIYPWLKNEILPSIDKTNIYLHSAMEQYVDHLEGLFSLREIDKPRNMKLQDFIKTQLGIQDDKPEEAIEILSGKETELNNAISQIQQLKSKYNRQIVERYFVQWEELLHLDFPDLKIVGDKFILNNNIINTGVKLSVENKDFVAILECNNCDKPYIYFGIGSHFVSDEKYATPESIVRILFEKQLLQPEDFWYGWKSTLVENAYADLKTLIHEIIKSN